MERSSKIRFSRGDVGPRVVEGRLLSVVLLATGLAAIVAPASAAVRLCEATISTGPVRGPNEDTARAAAIAIWKSKALEHGEPYGSWRIAAEKIFQCLPRKDGGLPARPAQRRQHRRRMAQTIEEIQREIEEGPPRRTGPYGAEPDPRWWEEYYGEGIEP